MAQPPVIFLAFANDPDVHLELLKQESRGVYRALQALHDKRFVELYREESADIDGLFEDFSRFRDRICIFHYGGHAGSTHLRLEDQPAGATGLAELLSEQKEHLQLVFLNGCSTLAQVERLHDLGIRAVIATSVPIQDEKATGFAVRLYAALANAYSLEQAFDHAVAWLKSRYDSVTESAIHRGLDWDPDSSATAWGLYVKEGAETVLQWKLPQYQKVDPPKPVQGPYEVNQDILRILVAMAEFDPALQSGLQNRRNAPFTIVEHFPWAMGAQIRKLFANIPSMNQPGMPRLRQLIQTYVATTRFLSFVLLSQVWDALNQQKLSTIPDVQTFFQISKSNYGSYDYLVLFQQCYELLAGAGLEPFIPEIKDSVERLKPGGTSFESWRFVESVRLRLLAGDIADAETRQLCFDSEAALTELLIKAAFLARYRLLTVKDIRIFNPRHLTAQFSHRMGELNVPHKDYLWEEDLSLDAYTESHSVLLIPKADEQDGKIDRFLNLSPFFMDKSAFQASQIPAIYAFSFPEGNSFHFQSVDADVNMDKSDEADWLFVDEANADFQLVFRLFQLFWNDLKKCET
jgi:hypothetical protein